ncbi:hypothetical protein PXO_05520 [Xanthomonas oryzae pv. oryzae PXO99A]|uniref:Uncharacterized protein n=1 Tax=Xanthomonas oryzae pv. oryzae (strain PXO99A) TaxID=360094 RepID=A0A0K0GIN4_XANOP|nr:hypothetical protein PXO_05520 [Xanthomonas oryzae pv. oryzae PXO99A]
MRRFMASRCRRMPRLAVAIANAAWQRRRHLPHARHAMEIARRTHRMRKNAAHRDGLFQWRIQL